MKPDHGQIDVGLKGVAVELSGDGMGDVQTLEPHPEFSFADVRGVPEQMLAEEPEKPSVPMTIHIQSEEPLWVRRDDFAVQMQPDLTIIVAGKKPLMKGKIDLLRGYISLLGQNFDIKRGQVVLGGSEEVDPQLEITAVHQSPRGAAVQLEVKGFVSQPQLTFRIEGNPNPVTAGEALFAINGRGGDTGSTAPEKQVANAAIGMATGLLSLGARREFGDWVPMLQVEQGDQTRVRVGLEADRFVPKFLKGFVRGAYVEGIVATESTNPGGAGTSSAQTNNASGNGVLLELTLPKNFVWAGQYGPGTAWSVDLDWRP
jgi:translocation and assembly module TamB